MEANSNTAETLANQAQSTIMELLKDDAKLKDCIHKVNEIVTKLNELMAEPSTKVRDRGPDSTRDMTEDDAKRILLGDLKDKSHKDAANELGLSYGQIYSARKGFTFKTVYKTWKDGIEKK